VAKTSRIGAAEDALYALLLARQAVSGVWALPSPVGAKVPVTLGHPGEELQLQHVWIPGEAESTQEWLTTMGTDGQKQELMEITAAVWVNLSDSGYAPNRDRALELAAEVELAIRQDFTIGTEAEGTVFQAEVTRVRTIAALGEFGRAVQALVDISVMSLLS
jgi:hypothetical protein